MKKSTLLQRAKKFLYLSNRHGVCLAMNDFVSAFTLLSSRYEITLIENEIEKEIFACIQPFSYADQWLYHQLFGDYKKVDYKKQGFDDAWECRQNWLRDNVEEIQKWRLRWMNKLIADYKAKGE